MDQEEQIRFELLSPALIAESKIDPALGRVVSAINFILSELDKSRDTVANLINLRTQDIENLQKIQEIVEQVRQIHPHDSMSADYYGISCEICKLLGPKKLF